MAPSKLTLHEYISQWKEKEHRELGIRPQTRDESHGPLRYAEKFFGPRLKLVEIRRRHVGEFAAWLMRQPGRRAETLSDKSIRNVLDALRQVLNTALDDELIPSHPMEGFKLKRQERIIEDDEIGNGQVKVFPGENGNVMDSSSRSWGRSTGSSSRSSHRPACARRRSSGCWSRTCG